MNLIPTKYNEINIGDICFIKTDAAKKGESQKVAKIQSWGTRSGLMFKLYFENKDEWFGWSDRLINKVGNEND